MFGASGCCCSSLSIAYADWQVHQTLSSDSHQCAEPSTVDKLFRGFGAYITWRRSASAFAPQAMGAKNSHSVLGRLWRTCYIHIIALLLTRLNGIATTPVYLCHRWDQTEESCFDSDFMKVWSLRPTSLVHYHYSWHIPFMSITHNKYSAQQHISKQTLLKKYDECLMAFPST